MRTRPGTKAAPDSENARRYGEMGSRPSTDKVTSVSQNHRSTTRRDVVDVHRPDVDISRLPHLAGRPSAARVINRKNRDGEGRTKATGSWQRQPAAVDDVDAVEHLKATPTLTAYGRRTAPPCATRNY